MEMVLKIENNINFCVKFTFDSTWLKMRMIFNGFLVGYDNLLWV